jgi:hypothetical protein
MGMTNVIVQIMVEVLTILAIATKGVKRGGLKKYLKKLTGNRDIEDSLDKLDKLTQEEAQMASAERLKMTRNVGRKVIGVDDTAKGVEEKVQDVRAGVHDVGDKVQDVDDKLDPVNRNQNADYALIWLSPPDPSTNHIIACKAHHNDTSQWFFSEPYIQSVEIYWLLLVGTWKTRIREKCPLLLDHTRYHTLA